MGCCGADEGEQTEPKEEFNKKRECTDVCCLVIFAVFLCVMIVISAFAIVYGNPKRLVNGFDSFGNVCGTENPKLGNMTFTGLDMSDKKYVFFFDVNDVFKTLKICVKQCPDIDMTNRMDLHNFGVGTGSLLCRYDVPLENYKSTVPFNSGISSPIPGDVLWQHVCPEKVYKSVPVLNRCVPKATNKLAFRTVYNIHAYLNDMELFEQIFSDLYASWHIMLGLTLAALVLSFLVTIFMYLFTYILSWVFMIILAVGSVAVTVVLWYTYVDAKHKLDSKSEAELLEESARNETAFLVFSVIATIFTIVLLLVIFYMRKQVRMLTNLFKMAGECIQSMPCLLLQPLWTFLALFAFFIFWVIVMLSLATSNTPSRHNVTHTLPDISTTMKPAAAALTDKIGTVGGDSLHTDFTSIQYNQTTWVKYSWLFFVIALIWVSEFILACQQMVIAGAAAFWYFSRDKERLHFPIARSFRHLVLYHMGSLALGSFLITLLKIPRLILTYLELKLNQYKDGGKCVDCARCCLRCCHCCFWCLTKFIKFVNHNAYSIVVFKGYSFCPAAKIAFESIMKNILKVSFVNSVGDCILFFGKCAVTVLMALAGLLIMKNDPNLHFYAVPILVVCIFSFFIAHCFLSVFEMVVDTLLLCFCEDFVDEGNQGDTEHKVYASEAMQTYLKQVSAELDNKAITDTTNERSQEPQLRSDPVSD